ncbi:MULTISPECIES: hydrogenase subunit MbhD domain-containing protein [Desulfonatronospira]|uniref:hydrogenase subunit MbhD domain-containing protein n=1 Tax=Desulfonatronospira TaxID=488937 RepID=UPI0001974FB1|nr:MULTISPECIES: hydrogenase subunit MbhD domain-containing protein [Desulfonatronospira]
MPWEIEFPLFIILLVAALIALNLKNLLAATVTLTIYSFTVALIMVSLGAVDVGFTEAVVGAGVVGIFLVVAIFKTTRKSCD